MCVLDKSMESKRSKIIFVLGAPGAGKGTLCKMLANEHGFRHLSVGDMLRQAVSCPDADQTMVEYVKRGQLLPTEMLLSILKGQMGEEGGSTIILDGFPRQLDQAIRFHEVFGDPHLVLFFDCPEELAEERVVQRLVGRDGDDRQTFQRRYREFTDLNPTIVDYYKEQNKLVLVDTSTGTTASYSKLQVELRKRREWETLVM